jgi:hypothetical protein
MSQREGRERIDGREHIVGLLVKDVRGEQQEQGVENPQDHERATEVQSDDHYQSFDMAGSPAIEQCICSRGSLQITGWGDGEQSRWEGPPDPVAATRVASLP